MVANRALQTVGTVVLVTALIAGAAGLAHVREARYPEGGAVSESSLYLTSGETLRRLTTGYNMVAADLYWIRAVQYYGDVKLHLTVGGGGGNASGSQPAAYELLYPLLDLTTSLDPAFNIAYRFGSIFLAEAYPGGAGRPDLAIALLEKGLRNRPDKWEYMQDIGFVHYWWRRDYRAASSWFERASTLPGAPWFLKSLAATTLTEGGDRRSSRTMWEAIRANAEVDWLRTDAERRLMQLDALDFIEDLQKKVDQQARLTGTPPSDWNALVRAQVIPGIPVDPARTPYTIDSMGQVGLSRESPLYPLPDEPRRIAVPGS